MKTWAIVAAAVIIGISVAIFGFSNDSITQSTVSDIESTDIKSQGVTTTLTPEIITIESTSQVVSSEDYTVEVKTDNLETQSYLPKLYFKNAFAITSLQSSVTVTKWSGALDDTATFDLSGNQFSTAAGQFQIAFINVTDNSKKTWTLPNDDRTTGRKMDLASNGDLFFGKERKTGSGGNLTRLNPSTNVFTEYNFPIFKPRQIFIDSSDDVFFSEGSANIHRLVPSTNTFTSWEVVGGRTDIDLDSSKTLYLSQAKADDNPSVGKLDTNTNTLTTWAIPNAINTFGISSDSSGNIFFIFNDGVRAKLGRITTSDNTLTEWIIPNTTHGSVSDNLLVDSNGNVFFPSVGLTRFVPSTETFTVFSGISCRHIEPAPFDSIYCVAGSNFSKIT